MAASSSIISISSASLFTPKIQCLPKHNKDHDHVPIPSSSSFTTHASLKISRPTTTFGITTTTTRLNFPPRRLSCSASASSSSTLPSALLFDCDGVLVDTEKDGHRISFNQTFQEVHLYIYSIVYTLFHWASRITMLELLNSLFVDSTMLLYGI